MFFKERVAVLQHIHFEEAAAITKWMDNACSTLVNQKFDTTVFLLFLLNSSG